MILCVDLFCLSLTSLFNNRTWSSITSSNNACCIVKALPWLATLVTLRMPNILALTSNLEPGNIGKVGRFNVEAPAFLGHLAHSFPEASSTLQRASAECLLAGAHSSRISSKFGGFDSCSSEKHTLFCFYSLKFLAY